MELLEANGRVALGARAQELGLLVGASRQPPRPRELTSRVTDGALRAGFG
ncbi:hypothetical protein [Streptomyces siamensis]